MERRLLLPVDLPPGEHVSFGFTAEQQAAIDRRTEPLFLHAGAGSGKTSVLVERFVRAVLDDEVPVDRILAITFTEKAAAELKGRIRARLLEAGERDRAREAEGAWISTIHGFCARLLRGNALAAGIDPEFRVLDEPEAMRLASIAFDAALEEFLGEETDRARVELVAAYRPDELQKAIRAVYEQLRSRGQEAPELPRPEPPEMAAAHDRLRRAVEAAAAGFGTHAGRWKTVDDALDRLTRCGEALDALRSGEPADPFELAASVVGSLTVKAVQGPVLDELLAAQGDYLRRCRARRALPDLELIDTLLGLFSTRYAALKDSASALDFEDLQLQARDLLLSEPGLQAELRARFAHVMVDEFQDTNRLQNSLLDRVAGANLFTVGDEFQSIYGFRNADVGVFRRHRDRAAAGGRDARLRTNFRSDPEILDAVNIAFAEALGEGYMPLRAPEGRAAASSGPPVELLVVAAAGWEELGEDPFGASLRDAPVQRAAEARLLARRIGDLVAAGEAEPGEVAILLRALTDVGVYERALADRGIPTYVAGGRGYFGQQQVADIRAYLTVLANPLDELALLSVLASPLVGASLDAVALAKLAARAARRDLWRGLQAGFAPDGDGGEDGDGDGEAVAEALPEADRPRVRAFVERLAAERRVASRLSLEALIDRAVTASGYDRAVLAMPNGDRRMANVRKLMRLAREFEAREGRDLRRFIDVLAERDLADAREGEAPLESEDLRAVRLMTVHAAKGLEFPVVCVADLGRKGQPDQTPVRVTDEGLVGLRVTAISGDKLDGLDLEQVKAEQQEAADQEDRRLLYVAATRAERRLILSGATDVTKWPPARSLGPPVNWAWRAFAPELSSAAGAAHAGAFTRETDGRDVRIGWQVLTPASAEALLPAPDRAPAGEALGSPASVAGEAIGPDPPGRAEGAPPPPRLAPVPAAAPPAAVGRLSYSSLESYHRCGYRFYLERILRLPAADPDEVAAAVAAPPPPAEEGSGQLTLALPVDGRPPGEERLPALLRGSVVHELLERLDFGRPAVPGAGQVTARVASHGGRAEPADVADLQGMVRGFLGSALFRRAAAAARVRPELPFAFTLGGEGTSDLLIDGVVDLLFEEDEATVVIDYKSDRVEDVDLEALVAERYDTQRLVYALAALRAGAARVEVVHLFLERPEAPVTAAFAAGEVPELEERLRRRARPAVDGRFIPTAEPHMGLCGTCPGRPALCWWELQETGTEPALA